MAVTEETAARLLEDAKPCPFCGCEGQDKFKFVNCDSQVRGGLWHVECGVCRACGPVANFHVEALRRWNLGAE